MWKNQVDYYYKFKQNWDRNLILWRPLSCDLSVANFIKKNFEIPCFYTRCFHMEMCVFFGFSNSYYVTACWRKQTKFFYIKDNVIWGRWSRTTFFISKFLFISVTICRTCVSKPTWNISSSRTFAGLRPISLYNTVSLFVGVLLCLCEWSFF